MIQRILRGSIDQEQEMRGTTEWTLRQQADECEQNEIPDSKAKSPENAPFRKDVSKAKAAEQAGEKVRQIQTSLYLPVRQRELPHKKCHQAKNDYTNQK